ncbi:MAG: protoporphyrinogen oxidase, partial [Acidobacteriota bacterium]
PHPSPPADSAVHDLAVVGAGVSGLTLAFWLTHRARRDVVVLEQAPRPGGKLQTEWLDGYCCEWGPQGFLDSGQDTLRLVRELGLEADLRRADGAAGDRFILRDGRLRRVPLSPLEFLRSDVLSLTGRLRVLLEPFQPRARAGDESVFAFACRRIGREAAEVLVDAMVTGVFAGDARQLSLPATFPRMRDMESTHGSLFWAMLALRRQRTRQAAAEEEATPAGGPAGPAGTLATLRLGMQQLTDALAAALGPRLRLACPVTTVQRRAGGFTVHLAGGEPLHARHLALAVPPGAAAALLRDVLDPAALAALREIPSIPIAVVMTGYSDARPFRHPVRGFGFLVPARERRRILGTIFCSSTFPGQAPGGKTLLRTLVGGARHPQLAHLPDADLLSLVRQELDTCLGGDPQPEMVHIVRHDEAIPQYTLGHASRVAAVQRGAAAVPGLYLLGNGYGGVAVNACVTEATQLAARLAS